MAAHNPPFLVPEIHTTMPAGLVMDLNLLRTARLGVVKGLCTKFWYKIHGTRYSTKVWYYVGYKVQGTGYKVQARRYKVQGTSEKAQGTRYKVQVRRYKVQYMIQGTGYKVQVRRYKVQGTGYKGEGTRYRIQVAKSRCYDDFHFSN